MSNQNQIANQAAEEAKIRDYNIEMGQALNRLRENPDFQLVIQEGYLTKEVMGSVSLLAVPQISEQGKRPGVFEDLIAASNLDYFFRTIESFYQGAVDPILSDEEIAAMAAEGEE